MSWPERWRTRWEHTRQWRHRWLRPAVVGLAILLTASFTAYTAIRLLLLAIGHEPAAAADWPPTPPSLSPLPSPSARPVETPREAAEHRRGLWVLGLSVGTLLVLVVAALVAQTLFQDRRPADYFQPVGARPLPASNLLEGYHWVDQNAGVVQIPIDRAMDLLIQRGLPARSAAESQVFTDHGQGGPSDSSGGRSP